MELKLNQIYQKVNQKEVKIDDKFKEVLEQMKIFEGKLTKLKGPSGTSTRKRLTLEFG